MSSLAGYLVAFGGGILSFASPCVLPLLPVYLSVITGLDVPAISSGRHRTVIARDTVLFVLGFGSIFVVLGTSASAIGRLVFVNHALLTRAAGVFVMAMALFLVGSQLLALPVLAGERRLQLRPSRFGPFAAPAAGAAFALGWTPCIGPILGSVLTVAGTQGDVARGAALLGSYSLGLGVPFLLAGLLASRVSPVVAWLRRRHVPVTLAAALTMAFFGALLVTDRLSWLTSTLQARL